MLATVPFDAAAVLDCPEAIEEFLADAYASEDPALIAHASGIAERSRALAQSPNREPR